MLVFVALDGRVKPGHGEKYFLAALVDSVGEGHRFRSKLAENSDKVLGAAAIVGARRLGRDVRQLQA